MALWVEDYQSTIHWLVDRHQANLGLYLRVARGIA